MPSPSAAAPFAEGLPPLAAIGEAAAPTSMATAPSRPGAWALQAAAMVAALGKGMKETSEPDNDTEDEGTTRGKGMEDTPESESDTEDEDEAMTFTVEELSPEALLKLQAPNTFGAALSTARSPSRST